MKKKTIMMVLLMFVSSIVCANINVEDKKNIKLKNEVKSEKYNKENQKLVKLAIDNGIQYMPMDKIELLKMIDSKENPITRDKFILGKALFFDPRLSVSGLVSCNTCHNVGLNGVDGLPAAIGDKWSVNPHHLNSPTVYNAVFNKKQFWDGRSGSLENQAIGPIQAKAEMNSSPEFVANFIKNTPSYLKLFRKIKKDDNYNPTLQDVGDVIAIFERTLVTPSRFDNFLSSNGKSDFTKKEKRGLKLFITKGCVSCHNSINLGGDMQPFPVMPDYKYKYNNIGDFKGDKNNLVKVPTLRNINRTAPYFHNGAVKTLKEAIDIMAEAQLGIKLNEKEIKDIEAFLKTLEGMKIPIVYPMFPDTKNNY